MPSHFAPPMAELAKASCYVGLPPLELADKQHHCFLVIVTSNERHHQSNHVTLLHRCDVVHNPAALYVQLSRHGAVGRI
jgi:hypothetical protein